MRLTGRNNKRPGFASGSGSGREWVAWLARDVRFAIRSFARTPLFSVTVLAILTLGIGATTAIFTVVDSLIVRGVPFENADELVRVDETYQPEGGALERRAVSHPDFRDWRDNATAFAEIGIRDVNNVTLMREGADPVRVSAAFISPSYFAMLGATPSIGRLLIDADDHPDGRVVVLSDSLWRARFDADPSVVGTTVVINEVSAEVVGVAGTGYGGPFGGVGVWMPYTAEGAFVPSRPVQLLEMRGARGFFVMGRLRPGAGIAEAQRQIDIVTADLHAQGLVPTDRGAIVVSFEDEFFAASQRTALMLFGAVGLVLLIACANVANLILARQLTRVKEISLRQALGAGRGAIARQLVVEGLLLGLVGGALGSLASIGLVDALAATNISTLPNYFAPSVTGTSVAFSVGISVATGLLFGLLPVFAGKGVALSESLKSASRSFVESGGPKYGTRQLLVVGQVAVAVLLLAAAGLTIKSIGRQLAIDTGFDPTGVTIAQLGLPGARYDAVGQVAFARRLEQALEAHSAVRRATVSSDIPLLGGYSAMNVTLDSDPEFAGENFRVYIHVVSSGYFETMGLPIVQGRAFADSDTPDSPDVVIVSEQMAARFWPGETPVGKLVSGREIVGVVSDARHRGLAPDLVNNPNDPDIFVPWAQRPMSELNVAVRGRTTTIGLADLIRAEVRLLDAALPVYGISTMDDVVEAQVAANRAAARQLGVFALIALVLAVAGLYGVMAYQVSRRTGEIGVRIALGAGRRRVLGMILRQGLTLVGIGLVTGLAIAVAGGRVIESQLYDVAVTDPATYAVVVLVFASVGALACLVPATRAMRVDPVTALRED